MKFTSIKQIPKEAIEMIDDVQWFETTGNGINPCDERLSSIEILEICNYLHSDGVIRFPSFNNTMYYIAPGDLKDKTYGINLYKKIHGEGR